MNSKLSAKLLYACVGALAAVALAAPIAQAATPAPGYERFAGCPSQSENSSIEACVHSVVTGGYFKMGNKNVPITNPITVVGGVGFGLSGFSANSKGGMTLVKQQVPGGVVGLTGLDWLVNFLNLEALKLYAVTELAGTPELTLSTLSLPIKVHLINPVLGNKCYVGSNVNPIKLNLTVETTSPPLPNEPISGTLPEEGFDPETEVLSLSNGTYVDNAFAAPGASGCTLTLLGLLPVNLDGTVNLASGLPAAAGTNETVQNIDTEITPVSRVYP
jgi:hypothetical protein